MGKKKRTGVNWSARRREWIEYALIVKDKEMFRILHSVDWYWFLKQKYIEVDKLLSEMEKELETNEKRS